MFDNVLYDTSVLNIYECTNREFKMVTMMSYNFSTIIQNESAANLRLNFSISYASSYD